MGYLPQVDLGDDFEPFARLREGLGFIPNLFRAQSLLPRVIEAEALIASTLLLREGALSRIQKEAILLSVAAASRNIYCVTAHCRMLRDLGVEEGRLEALVAGREGAGGSPSDRAMIAFARRLSREPSRVTRDDTDHLRRAGLSDGAILETVLVTALTDFLCALATGLGVTPDFPAVPLPDPDSGKETGPASGNGRDGTPAGDAARGPWLPEADVGGESFPPFAFFLDRFGFVPNIFRAQTLRPDMIEAEARAVGAVLLSEDVLSRVRKESILLAVSASNFNTYCVRVHCEMLRNLGMSIERADRIAVDHRHAGLPETEVALIDFALALNDRPRQFGAAEIDGLRRHGFTDPQILEAVVMTALTNFLNTVQIGIAPEPDFEPIRVFRDDCVNPPGVAGGPMIGETRPSAEEDADRALVERVLGGETDAFAGIVQRHERRLYRTLVGLTGSREDAEDALQNAFLKAYRNLRSFRGTSRLSTWLTRIAINEGVERLRGRRGMEPIDAPDAAEGEEDDFRPRRLDAWEETPEELLSRSEMRALVERELLRLPAHHRMAVILRDLEGMTTGEAAEALGLGAATLKTHLMRGRLRLREALAAHFTRRGAETGPETDDV